MRRATIALALALALAGCGGSGDKDDDGDRTDATPTATATPVEVVRITRGQAGLIKARMPKERVEKLLRGEPLLTQQPYGNFPGGCWYYAMADTPLANVWQFCFDKVGVKLVLTAFSQSQPDPPAEASPARAALIARADTVCQGQNARLGPTTDAVALALSAFAKKPTNELVLKEIDTQLRRFVRIIEDTHEPLEAFDEPEDAKEAYVAYLDGLQGQAETLEEARKTFKAGELDRYEELGDEFTRIGKEAKQAAEEYGFTQCSASSFG